MYGNGLPQQSTIHGSWLIAPTRISSIMMRYSSGGCIHPCLTPEMTRMGTDKTPLCSTLHENLLYCASMRPMIFSGRPLRMRASHTCPRHNHGKKLFKSFFVINEQVESLLEFVDLLQNNTKRDNMVHTGSSGTESCLLPSESCVILLLYPVKDHFAEDFENDTQ